MTCQPDQAARGRVAGSGIDREAPPARARHLAGLLRNQARNRAA